MLTFFHQAAAKSDDDHYQMVLVHLEDGDSLSLGQLALGKMMKEVAALVEGQKPFEGTRCVWLGYQNLEGSIVALGRDLTLRATREEMKKVSV